MWQVIAFWDDDNRYVKEDKLSEQEAIENADLYNRCALSEHVYYAARAAAGEGKG